MLFKNAIFYKLEEPIDLTNIEKHLNDLESVEPTKHALVTIGFTPVLQDGEQYVHSLMGTHTFCLRQFKKTIPASVVAYKLKQRVKIIEEREKEPVPKKMQKQLKEEIVNELAAFTPAAPSVTYFTYFEKKQVLVVNSSSFSKAEACLSMLRKALGTLKVLPLLQKNVGTTLTSWCFDAKERPDIITILEKGKLYSNDENKAEASFNRQTMDADEVVASYESGKVVKEMAMQYDDQFSFVFTEAGIIKSIKFTDIARESMSEIPKNEMAAVFDASMAINIDTIGQFSSFLTKEFPHK
jgi:recombination associated protein RdgC